MSQEPNTTEEAEMGINGKMKPDTTPTTTITTVVVSYLVNPLFKISKIINSAKKRILKLCKF
jgi:hypothetical protein